MVVEEKARRGRGFFDGKIIVATGLLDHFSMDAEIAFVLAHEVHTYIRLFINEAVNFQSR